MKLLGIEIDNMLSYKAHVNVLCRKINAKINALKRISPLLSLEQHRAAIVNSFVSSELNYCPLVWSFANKGSLTRLQNLQDRVEVLLPTAVTCASIDEIAKLFYVRFLRPNMDLTPHT